MPFCFPPCLSCLSCVFIYVSPARNVTLLTCPSLFLSPPFPFSSVISIFPFFLSPSFVFLVNPVLMCFPPSFLAMCLTVYFSLSRGVSSFILTVSSLVFPFCFPYVLVSIRSSCVSMCFHSPRHPSMYLVCAFSIIHVGLPVYLVSCSRYSWLSGTGFHF